MTFKFLCLALYAAFSIEVYSKVTDRGDIPKQPFCRLPSETGPGRAAFPKWYFDDSSKRCERFTFGGMGGNENRFGTKKECERVCIDGIGCPHAEHPPPGCRANQEKGEDGCAKNDIICDVKPGRCPTTYSPSCTHSCAFGDSECRGTQKCCRIGCNVVCVEPLP